jgi:hypothetical protein
VASAAVALFVVYIVPAVWLGCPSGGGSAVCSWRGSMSVMVGAFSGCCVLPGRSIARCSSWALVKRGVPEAIVRYFFLKSFKIVSWSSHRYVKSSWREWSAL